jgi:hypothetical protein
MHMQDFATADEFFEAILKAWHAEWQRVYGFDWAQSQPFEDGGVDYNVFYTPSIKILSVLSQGTVFQSVHPVLLFLSIRADISATHATPFPTRAASMCRNASSS